MVSCGQAADHETNHTNPDHRLAMIHADLIVAAKPSRLKEPTKGSFYDPPLGQNLEALGLVRSSDDLQPQLAKRPKLLDPLDQGSQIATIGPDDLHSLIQSNQDRDEILGRSRG